VQLCTIEVNVNQPNRLNSARSSKIDPPDAPILISKSSSIASLDELVAEQAALVKKKFE